MPHKSSTNIQRVSRFTVGYADCNHCDRKFNTDIAYRLHLKANHPGKNDKLNRHPINMCGSCKKVLPGFARRCDRGCA